MKLRPRQGIDELCFGDSQQKAVAVFGSPEKERSHPKDGRSSWEFTRKNLTLGFDTSGRLNFIAALRGAAEVELWGERPFAVVAGTTDEVSAVRSWVMAHGRKPVGHHDSFGGSFEVAEEGVIFCFDHDGRFEGIQAVP